jgi:hypothetical protein
MALMFGGRRGVEAPGFGGSGDLAFFYKSDREVLSQAFRSTKFVFAHISY